ncbi:uncharacterized protein LOC141904321 [Tubulanus polymorphus]|uniref:uncharacterized protein LOC141904321 n=1 Tax=Tubulanus polymorphus TaxID=672921 RepID=UPI003DA40D29
MTVNKVRKRFWITSLRSLAKKILRKCVTCKRLYGRPYLAPPPPPLPSFRVNELKPFTATAIDFTGHLYVRGENEVYICLFTCCTTRAIHLEIVTDATVDSYIRAFRRFCSSYSAPNIIYSDNAKTFIAGEAEIKRLYEIASSDNAQKIYADKRMKFKYTPVQAPWMAGVHERCIGIVKTAIKKVLAHAQVSLDELQTLIKEIQATINNRPLNRHPVRDRGYQTHNTELVTVRSRSRIDSV